MNLGLKIKGKKSGIVGSALTDFWSYVILVFVVLIFFVFFAIQKNATIEEFIHQDLNVKLDLSAVNYLRMPVDIETDAGKVFISQDTNFADFIVGAQRELFSSGDHSGYLEKIDNMVGIYIPHTKFPPTGRLMIVWGPSCWYDSWNQGCNNRQPIDVTEPEGIVTLAVPGIDKQFIDFVLQ